MDKRKQLKKPEAVNGQSKLALANSYLAKDCLVSVIEISNYLYKTDRKKTFAQSHLTTKNISEIIGLCKYWGSEPPGFLQAIQQGGAD